MISPLLFLHLNIFDIFSTYTLKSTKRRYIDVKIKKPKKITKAKLKSLARTAKRKALSEWSKAVRNRDGNKCAVCGKTEHLNAHHILNKTKFPQYRLELICGIALCPSCHQFGKFAAETNVIFFANFLIKNRPEQWNWAIKMIQNEQNII